MIDKEVSKIIDNEYQRAKDLLISNKEKVKELASNLLSKEVIFKTDLEKIFGAGIRNLSRKRSLLN